MSGRWAFLDSVRVARLLRWLEYRESLSFWRRLWTRLEP